MEDEFVKRNTDCVYFLASPFTCKKGAECEYRHSEMARLNPRDCWYWLSANCLNPTCAFRHPPLDLHNEASAEAAPPLMNQSSVSAIKTKVPCYYYYNGFCIKGDRCPYLHEHGDTFNLKQKMVDSCADAPVLHLDKKTSGGADSGSILAGKHSNLSETVMKTVNELQGERNQLAQQPVNAIFTQPNISENFDIPQCDETVAGKTASLVAEASIKSESVVSLDSERSSEELIDGNIIRDEWLESSPGFDVLVEGNTEDIVCEDDPEYLHPLDRDDEDCERLFMPRGFSHKGENGERTFFDNGLYESFEHFDDELRARYREHFSRRTQDRKARRVVASKRKFFCEESPVSDCHDVDLRDYLRRRRMVDGYLETHDLRHNLLHRARDDRQERVQRYTSVRRTHGRMVSKVERNGARFHRRKYSAVDTEQRSRPRNSQSHHSGFRRYNGMKLQQSLTERRPYLKSEVYARESKFYGPKSLSVTKEDRKVRHFNKIESVDFEGPKPLSEILKDKKKTSSSCDDILSSRN